MAKSRRNMRRASKSRKSRRTNRKSRRAQRGGQAPVNYSNPGPMNINLAQGRQYDAYHANQHGGGLGYGPYPGAVDAPTVLPADLTAAARLLPLNDAFAQIRGMTDQDGGRRRRGRKGSRKGSRKSRKSYKKQRGGDFVRWGGARRLGTNKRRMSRKRSSKKGRKGTKKQRGGSYAEMRFPMPVGDESKMLIPASLQAQAGLNPEWKLAENPLSFAPY